MPKTDTGPKSIARTDIRDAIPRVEERKGDVVVTYSELDTYRQCPLKWSWAYRDRWGKEAKPGSPLLRGSLWHLVMEEWYQHRLPENQSDLDPKEIIRRIVEDHLHDEAGGFTPDQELIGWMFEGHIAMWGMDEGWDILAVEVAGQVKLADATPDHPAIWLQFKIDMVIRDRATGRIWIVDHKSASNFSRPAEIDLDDQFGLYTWALRKCGIPVFGFIRSDARTQRNKGPMELDQRFRRVQTYRSDVELESVADEAIEVAKVAYSTHGAPTYSATAPDRCFTGDTLVRPIGDLQRVSRRWYVGPVVEVETAGGQKYTGTAEHPVLTESGWVPLCDLREGDRVVHTRPVEQGVSGAVADDQQGYVEAAELFNSAQGVVDRGVPCQFHGEVPNQNVDVVTVDSSLGAVRDAEVVQPTGELGLVFAQVRPIGETLLALHRDSAEGLVRGRAVVGQAVPAERHPLLGGPSADHEGVGLGGSTRSQASPGEVFVHRSAAYAVAYREGLHRFAVNEQTDEVVRVVVREFAGHVYNLQTSSGTYQVHGTTALNCTWRCDFLEAHLALRKTGYKAQADTLRSFGFEQRPNKHREYSNSPT